MDTKQELNEMVSAIDTYIASVDVDALAGADAAELLRSLLPSLRRLGFHAIDLGAHAVAANQHTTENSRSAASWLGAVLGVSERAAASQLSTHRDTLFNPDVRDLVESGSLSFEKGALVTRLADGSDSITQGLLPHAQSDSYEYLRQRAVDLVAKKETSRQQRKRLRGSQYINITDKPNDMIKLELVLMRSNAAPWLARWKQEEQKAIWTNQKLLEPLPFNAALAEAFSALMLSSSGGGSSRAVFNYHIDLEDWQNGWPGNPTWCELAGVGAVPIEAVNTMAEHPALRLLIKSRNKLLWYSEATYRPAGPLPEFMKRAVKANQRDRCATSGCVGSGSEVDHDLARTNGGDNAFENLQALCEPDHDVKTKHDAPWTQGGIFGKNKRPPPLADTG